MNSSLSSSSPIPRIVTHSRQSSRALPQQQNSLKELEPQSYFLRKSSLTQNQQPIKIEANLERDLLQTRGSFCSRQSMRSSRYSATSRSSWYNQLDEFHAMSIARLTDLLDGLLSLRLEYFSNGEVKAEDKGIMTDINRKLQLIKRVIMKRDQQELTPEIYSMVNQRIEMIDKIMAEQWVESEYIKKKFNAAISKSTSNNRYGECQRRASCARLKQFMNGVPEKINTCVLPSPHKTLVVQTRYKSQYQSPNHQSIKLYKIPKTKYIRNNAPIPSSNYKSEYFDYKSLFKQPIGNYKDSSNLSLGYHQPNFRSNYKSDYKESHAVKDDYKLLDCYRDKIKTLKLIFMSKKIGATKQELQDSLLKRDNRTFSPKNNIQTLKAYDGQFLSNNKMDYKLPSIFSSSKPKYDGIQNKRMNMKFKSLKNRMGEKENWKSKIE